MEKVFKIALLLLCSTSAAFTQDQELTSTLAQEFVDNLSSQPYFQTEVSFDHSFKGTKGSPYLLDNWQTGSLELMDGRQINGELLYDMVNDQLILKRTKTSGVTLKRNKVRSFTLNHTKYLNPNSTGFYHQMSDGQISLLVKRTKRLRSASDQTIYSTNQDYHQYLDQKKYFLRLPDDSLVKCPKSVAGIIKLFPDHKKEIKAFAQTNQIFLQNEHHLLHLINHCDQLLLNNL